MTDDPQNPIDTDLDLEALLRRHAGELRGAARLASPESLLWRARLRQRIARAETTGRLLSLYDRIALGVGVAAAGLFVAWNWDAVVDFFPRFELGSGNAGMAGLISGVGVLALVALVFWAMSIWAEE